MYGVRQCERRNAGDQPLWDRLVDIAEQHGIFVFLVDGLERAIGIKGLWVKTQFKSLIFIDQDLSQPNREFILAHELGHAFLHSRYPRCNLYFPPPGIEDEANQFATRLLEQIDREARGMWMWR